MKLFDILLKRSNSYNYYKNNYFKLEKSDKTKQKEISNLEKKLKLKDKRYDKLSKKYSKLSKKYDKLNKSYDNLNCKYDDSLKVLNSFENNFSHINEELSNLKNKTSKDIELTKKKHVNQ